MSTRKKTPKTAGFVAYYRVSDLKQEKSGLGLAAQREWVERLARDAPILAEYTETESGKKHQNRPQLLAALADARKRNATLLIAKLDRLARNVAFIANLMEGGVPFKIADMPEATPFTIHILAAVAEHERKLISQRTKDGLAAAKREIALNGFRISRKSGRRFSKFGNPRWQESIAKATAARKPAAKAAAEAVALIRTLREQRSSFRAIAGRLNELGLKTPGGARWYASTVRSALLDAAH